MSTTWVSVFNNNPYATDFIVTTKDKDYSQIVTATIGGSIEKFFFLGKKPDDNIRTYSRLTGMPTLMPNWAFGW